MRTIKVLPESVRSSLRSGIILFDLIRVVEELVYNSLDAGATKVIVAVCVGTNYVKVTDNGCGITRDGLMLLGERFATSKFEQLADMNTVPESFGFRGEALSSISDVSLLEVVTKVHGMPNGYRKVMKGCKCLYLGIDDDIQDAGTTVVVHDLFYNQPVRRRHLQSSPQKVLHSVKESILRIALVHLGTCFKVIDIESGGELLCLYPSSSPLPILTSGFGSEVSSSLHKLDVSDGELKLSGYISGLYETYTVKAFQYFYISSRYISRGPIHKFLNQLATMHRSSDLLKADIRSQCGKRNRCQTTSTYILNLSCPRAHYDLSFEANKTCVEFKDWDPVFTFIKKAVSCFWSPGAHMSQEDNDLWNGPNGLPTRDDVNDYRLPKKRCMPQCHRASVVLSSPQLEVPGEETNHMSYSRYSCNRSQNNNVQFEDYGMEMDFASLPDNSPTFSPRSLAICDAPIPQESSNDLGVHPSYPSLETKYIEEPFNGHLDQLSDAKWYPNSPRTDFNPNNTLAVKEPSAVLFHIDDDREKVNDDLMKPFMRSCSSRLDQSPFIGSISGDYPSRFQADEFRKWLHMDDRFDNRETGYVTQGSEQWLDDTTTVWSPPRITTSCKLDTDSSLSKEPFDSHLTSGDCCTQDSSHWECSKSSHLSSKFDWSASMFGEKVPVKSSTDIMPKRGFKHPRDDVFDLSADEGENNIFNFDNMRDSSSREDYSLSCDMLTPSFLKGCKTNVRNIKNGTILFHQPWDYLYEAEWRHSESCGKHKTCLPVAASHHMSSLSYADERKSKITQCRFLDKQPRRSCSAPPFYRGKKKFVTLNRCMTIKPGKSHNHNPSTKEASHLKHIQRPSDVDLTLDEGFTNDLHSARDYKKIIDKSEILHHEGEAAHCVDVYNTDSDFSSMEYQGALDFGGKWRNDSIIEKPGDLGNQDSILDISSGILHLSGNSLLPKSISKKCLEDCRVLQQVDKKFIPVVGGGILAIIDQHAADERIRLEDLRAKVLSGKMKTINYLDAEQELVLPEIGFQLLNTYSDQIRKWGWICNFHSQSSVSFEKNLNFLHNQPSIAILIAVPCILGVNLTDVDLLEYLQQLSDTDGSSAIPPAVLRVLNFKACRGAIMFGDALLPSECSLLVEELKQTSLCFQCAHGRPTTVPLVNLAALHKQIAKLGKSSGPWHGLSHHTPSLERALRRLSSEGGQC